MWAEILTARLKPGWEDEDLDRLIRWNTEYHARGGVREVRYFVSEDRSRFVMVVSYPDRTQMERSREKWETSGSESQAWFRSLVDPLFSEGQSTMYSEYRLGDPPPG